MFAASLWLFGEKGSVGWHARIAKAMPATAIVAQVSHPSAMVVGFLIPIGMAMSEWRLTPELVDMPTDRADRIRIGAPFLGGILLMVGALFDPRFSYFNNHE